MAGGLPSERRSPNVLRTPAEERFEKARRTVGLFAGPAAFAALLIAPAGGLSPEAHRLAAVLAWVVLWWITEAVPIPVTALLGPAIAVLLGVAPAKEIFAGFGDPVIFLFLGGFLIAEAMTVHGLDRRIALALIGSRWVGARGGRILLGFGLLSALLSMWISNTATTAMLYPIALGVLISLASLASEARGASPGGAYGTGLLLACAYGASLGGIGTPVGSPPNLIVLGQLSKLADVRMTFFSWMLLVGPILLVMLALTLVYLRRRFPSPAREIAGAEAYLEEERSRLGPLTRGQINVIAAFSTAVFLWVLPGLVVLVAGEETSFTRRYVTLLPESGVALLVSGLLFVLPVDWGKRRFTLSWNDAVRIDWGTLILFGGGLALGGAMFRTGLAEALGREVIGLTGARSEAALTFVFTILAIYMTEVTSNTASATMLAPLAIAAAGTAGVDPVAPAVGCAIGCSMAFMLPVATPPNAIIYGSGLIPIGSMVRTGFWLNLAASVIVPSGILLLRRWTAP